MCAWVCEPFFVLFLLIYLFLDRYLMVNCPNHEREMDCMS